MSAPNDLYDDVQMMLSAGESVPEIARRLGLKPDSVARNLHRHGHTDTARRFWQYAKAAR